MTLEQCTLKVPTGYKSDLDIKETEIAIKKLKDFFERALAENLNLTRVSAPLFVKNESGINDNLNGTERPVAFDMKAIKGSNIEIVHSLAKWKRLALYRYSFNLGEGLYTDMNAIRRDEDLDNLHSIYVDQWDWEKVIEKSMRNKATLREIVQSIYKVFKDTEEYICSHYGTLTRKLPEEIFFITTQELEDKYPGLTAKERENAICKEKKAVFLMEIGGVLTSGEKHDGRAPDYDDWTLNGDILFWNPLLEIAFEVSSMGIRVDEESLEKQLTISNSHEKKNLEFHRLLLEGKLPYTIGGGIGQSRICMYFLDKAHIGEVQASIWNDEMIEECEKNNIHLL
ncbi:aspartate-ammonia ligase [Clostridium collagenovorans DSM 3089]|uniref:Aspartate--ammonia ligase n=1 Tax=Clostridium collagenovorans DSM 3089 TaxID=1121306 RepID=A0A1M5W0B2_9CLOT|nr:aspartate--ammonia ligase [Clostridium collagenovorans]SHH80870.1 aspartate-ammonia ligase [Clostridium collagenovorans DSM 3089]